MIHKLTVYMSVNAYSYVYPSPRCSHRTNSRDEREHHDEAVKRFELLGRSGARISYFDFHGNSLFPYLLNFETFIT